MGISVLYKPNVIIGNKSSSSVEPEQDRTLYNLLTDQVPRLALPLSIGITAELRSGAFANVDIRKIYLKNAQIIPDFCFANTQIDGVVGSRVYNIGEYAFNGCRQLKNVDIFSNCVTIGISAFTYCNALKSINISSPSVNIGTYAFSQCSNLETVSIYNAVLVTSPFFGCVNLRTADLGYTSAIGQSAFFNCRNLGEISCFFIENTVQSAFYNCYNLSKLGNIIGVSTVGNATFESCSSLSSIFMPFLNNMENSVFYNCIRLSRVELGDVSSVKRTNFKNCNSLRSLIFLTASCPSLASDADVFENTPIADSSYLGHFGSIYVPSYLVSTMKAAQNWSNYADRITSLPEYYDSKFVYAYEFYNQHGLRRIPSSKLGASYIGNRAFLGCSTITSASFSSCEYVGLNAFLSCSSLKSVDMPSCKFLLSGAFQYCSNLKSLIMPNIKYIGISAFAGCSQLSYINFSHCKKVGMYAFSGCRNLSRVNLPACEIVEAGAFGGCSNLSSLDLPNCVYYAGGGSTLTSINLPKAKIITGLGSIKISTIYFPECIYFVGCQSTSYVQEIYLPNAVTVYNCGGNINLRKIEIPNCVITANGAFGGCSSLSEIYLQKVYSIGYVTFSGCTNMQRAYFGNLKMIDSTSVFDRCQALNSLYLFSVNKVTMNYSNNFKDTPMTDSSYLGHYGSIYVPAYLVSEYQADSVWSYFSDRFVGLTDQEMQDIIDHWND